MQKPSLTLIVLTNNEELHLARCLKSAKGLAEEIIVVDSGSTDKTQSIARRHGAKVVEHEFKYQAQQFNWALEHVGINTEWILRLDADEYLLPELAEEISQTLSHVADAVCGFAMKRRVVFLGRWVRHGGYYPAWFTRLFRVGHGRYEDREMDEHLLVEGKVAHLRGDFVDENLKGLAEWTARHNDYSTREARERLRAGEGEALARSGAQAAGKRRAKGWYLHLPSLWRAFAYCTYRYIFRLGFLDGKEGLIFHFLQGCWHQFLIDAKMMEKELEKIKR